MLNKERPITRTCSSAFFLDLTRGAASSGSSWMKTRRGHCGKATTSNSMTTSSVKASIPAMTTAGSSSSSSSGDVDAALQTSQATAGPQYVVVAQETPVEHFTGTREQRELRMFLEDLDDMWVQRPDLIGEAKSRRTWGLLAGPVRRELRTQGLGPDTTYTRLMEALQMTYGD